MQADTALNEEIRERIFPNSLLQRPRQRVRVPEPRCGQHRLQHGAAMTDGVAIGPILMGVSKPAHILTPASTVRRVVNISAIACVEAQIRATSRERPA